MKENDVLVFMKSFSSEELKALAKYMKKRFQTDSIPMHLFRFLRKYYPDFEHRKLSYEYAHELLFPDTSYNKKMVLNTLSDLRLVIRDFLVNNYLDENPIEKDIILLRVYSQRQLDAHFEKQYKNIKKELAKKSQHNLWYWLNHVQVEHEKYFNIGTKRMIERGSIFQAMESLDQFYAAGKLRYASEIYSGYNLRNEEDPSVRFLKDIESAGWCDDSTYHAFYKKILPLVRDRKTASYEDLKTYFYKHYQALHHRDQCVVISYLINYIAFEIRRGNDDFHFELFELMKFGLLHDLFIVDGVLPPDHYMNIVTVASRIGHFDWALEFINNYAKRLQLMNRVYYKNYCQALIYFYRKDYKNCVKLLKDIDLKEPQDQYRGRWLKIISDFETKGWSDELSNQSDAFYQFIRRNKLIPNEKKNAMHVAYKAFKMLMSPNTTKAMLENLLEDNPQFHYKSWIDEKIKLLK